VGRVDEQTCVHCGRPTRYSVNEVYQCKDGHPTTPLPTPEAPVPVAVAMAAANDWEKQL